MLLNCSVGEDSWESLGLQEDQTSQSYGKSVLNNHWKDWCWSWNSNSLATWYKEVTHWERLWYCKRLKARGEEDGRGWEGWVASLTQWTWVWAGSRSWWWTGKLACCSSWGRQESNMTEWLNWIELNWAELGLTQCWLAPGAQVLDRWGPCRFCSGFNSLI